MQKKIELHQEEPLMKKRQFVFVVKPLARLRREERVRSKKRVEKRYQMEQRRWTAGERRRRRFVKKLAQMETQKERVKWKTRWELSIEQGEKAQRPASWVNHSWVDLLMPTLHILSTQYPTHAS
jgi:hypothetical protein